MASPTAADTRSTWTAGLAALRASTERLLITARGLDDHGAAAPSLLPGWSRGHVLSHLARNADGMRNLVASAAGGVDLAMYPSIEARNADIGTGAGRPAAELVADAESTAALLDADLAGLLDLDDAALAGALARPVVFGAPRPGAVPVPASSLLAARRRELEIHHADLGAGYGPADWPEDAVAAMLEDVARARRAPDGVAGVGSLVTEGRTVLLSPDGSGAALTGPAWQATWWLTGRDGHRDLLRDGDGGPAPAPVPW